MPIRRPACNPCRVAKLACDHVQPVCSRCRDRDQASACVYRSRPFKKNKAAASRMSHSASLSLSASAYDISRPNERPVMNSSHGGRKYPDPGYLGPSSHVSFFRQIVPDDVEELALDIPEGVVNTWHIEASQRLCDDGVCILERAFRDLQLFACAELVDEWLSKGINFALAGEFTSACMQSLLQVANRHAGEPKSELVAVSRSLFRQSASPLEINASTTLEDYKQSFCFQNCRWECLGLAFAAIARATLDIRVFKQLYTSDHQRRDLQKRATYFSDLCLDLCLSLYCLNDLQLVLQYENFILHSTIDGDQSYHSWKKLGDVASSLFALGYHDQVGIDTSVPLFIRELRRAAFARAFSADKNVSVFLGRPPRINGKYCRFQLPGSEFYEKNKSVTNRLPRSFEWNLAEKVDCYADTRWSALCAVLKEEILDLFREDDQNIRERKLSLIRADAEAQWHALPSGLRLQGSLKLYEGSPLHRDLAVTTRLNHLHVLFLLHSATPRHLSTPNHELITISFSMLQLVLEAALLKDRLANSGTSLVWKVAYYGLAAAGFLCVCLLNGAFERTSAVSFSKVFQSLSVLVAEVDTGGLVQIDDANYALLARATQTIKSLLDRLSPTPPPQSALPAPSLSNNNVILDDTEFGGTGEWDVWLNHFTHDFETDFWFNLAEHPFLTGT